MGFPKVINNKATHLEGTYDWSFLLTFEMNLSSNHYCSTQMYSWTTNYKAESKAVSAQQLQRQKDSDRETKVQTIGRFEGFISSSLCLDVDCQILK